MNCKMDRTEAEREARINRARIKSMEIKLAMATEWVAVMVARHEKAMADSEEVTTVCLR